VYTVLELHAAAQVPEDVPDEDELDEDDEEELDELEEDEEELDELPLSDPMYVHRLVVVGFQPVEL
jgi:hypothetical protein